MSITQAMQWLLKDIKVLYDEAYSSVKKRIFYIIIIFRINLIASIIVMPLIKAINIFSTRANPQSLKMRILLLMLLLLNLSPNFIAAQDEKDWWQTTVVSFNFVCRKFPLKFSFYFSFCRLPTRTHQVLSNLSEKLCWHGWRWNRRFERNYFETRALERSRNYGYMA